MLHFFQGARHSFLRRAFLDAKRRADFLQGFVLKIPQHDRIAVRRSEFSQGLIQERRDLMPRFLGRCFLQGRLQQGLLFPANAPPFGPLKIGRGEPRSVMQPAGQNCFGRKRSGLAREKDEDGLRDILRVLWIGRVAERDGINEVQMTTHERGESSLGIGPDEFVQQIDVRGIAHSSILCASDGKGRQRN